jgi:hypothetical protein
MSMRLGKMKHIKVDLMTVLFVVVVIGVVVTMSTQASTQSGERPMTGSTVVGQVSDQTINAAIPVNK